MTQTLQNGQTLGQFFELLYILKNKKKIAPRLYNALDYGLSVTNAWLTEQANTGQAQYSSGNHMHKV